MGRVATERRVFDSPMWFQPTSLVRGRSRRIMSMRRHRSSLEYQRDQPSLCRSRPFGFSCFLVTDEDRNHENSCDDAGLVGCNPLLCRHTVREERYFSAWGDRMLGALLGIAETSYHEDDEEDRVDNEEHEHPIR